MGSVTGPDANSAIPPCVIMRMPEDILRHIMDMLSAPDVCRFSGACSVARETYLSSSASRLAVLEHKTGLLAIAPRASSSERLVDLQLYTEALSRATSVSTATSTLPPGTRDAYARGGVVLCICERESSTTVCVKRLSCPFLGIQAASWEWPMGSRQSPDGVPAGPLGHVVIDTRQSRAAFITGGRGEDGVDYTEVRVRDLTTGERLYERDGFDGRTTLLRPHRKDLARGSFVFRGRYLLMLTALQLVRHGEKRISMLSVYDVEAHEPVLMEWHRRYRCAAFLDDERLVAVAHDPSQRGMQILLIHLPTFSVTHALDVPMTQIASVGPHLRKPYAYVGELCGERDTGGVVSHEGARIIDDGTAYMRVPFEVREDETSSRDRPRNLPAELWIDFAVFDRFTLGTGSHGDVVDVPWQCWVTPRSVRLCEGWSVTSGSAHAAAPSRTRDRPHERCDDHRTPRSHRTHVDKDVNSTSAHVIQGNANFGAFNEAIERLGLRFAPVDEKTLRKASGACPTRS